MDKLTERMSADDKRQVIQGALAGRYPHDQEAFPGSPRPYVRDVYDESVIFEYGGDHFEVGYTMEGQTVTFADDTQKVLPQMTYTSIETLRTDYADLIAEAVERGVEASAFKEVSELYLQTIDGNGDVDKAIESVASTAQWIITQEAMKAEDGERYPAAAYAYVPDASKPSTWKLRLWQDPTKKVTKRQLGAAAAAFSPGGFRGNKVELPASEVAGVKAKIRAEYRKLGVETEDMPTHIREVEMRERIQQEACEIAIEEVTKEGIANGVLPVRIIKPGFNTSKSRFYSEASITNAATIFDGAKMYADHATEAEEDARPERSIRDWVATLRDTKVSEQGNAVGTANIHAGWLKEMVQNLYKHGNLGDLGTSINAIGKGVVQTIEGHKTTLVEGLVASPFQSVDFVTEPGAGGQAGLRESATDLFIDAELIDLAKLRETRPDLVTEIEAEIKQTVAQEVREAMEATKEVDDLKVQVETLTTEKGELQKQIDEAAEARVKDEAQATIKDAVDKSELPEAAKSRLLERFADATTDEGVAEAITAEADYLATIRGDGEVKNMGDSKDATNHEAMKARKDSLEASVREANPGFTDEQVRIAVDGR